MQQLEWRLLQGRLERLRKLLKTQLRLRKISAPQQQNFVSPCGSWPAGPEHGCSPLRLDANVLVRKLKTCRSCNGPTLISVQTHGITSGTPCSKPLVKLDNRLGAKHGYRSHVYPDQTKKWSRKNHLTTSAHFSSITDVLLTRELVHIPAAGLIIRAEIRQQLPVDLT